MLKIVLACFSMLTASHAALALVAGELMVGQRTSKWGEMDKNMSGTQIHAGVHLDPIPLVPVAFGLSLKSQSYGVKAADHGFSELAGLEVSPEVMAWLPLGDLKPFGRLGYALGTYKGKTSVVFETESVNVDYVFKTSGLTLGAGVKYSLLPLVSLQAELQLASHTVKTDSAKASGASLEKPKDDKDSSTTILIGASVGI